MVIFIKKWPFCTVPKTFLAPRGLRTDEKSNFPAGCCAGAPRNVGDETMKPRKGAEGKKNLSYFSAMFGGLLMIG